jgi:hypothetical protein
MRDLKGRHLSLGNESDVALKRHHFSLGNESDVALKGHDFSRADEDGEENRALAPEGKTFKPN